MRFENFDILVHQLFVSGHSTSDFEIRPFTLNEGNNRISLQLANVNINCV